MTREPEHRTATSDDSLVPVEDKTCTAWFDFTRAMEGRTYGAQETLDAWLWFRAGWYQGSDSAMTASKRSLVVIGHIGDKYAYLDVTREEAVRRYARDEAQYEESIDPRLVSEFKFTDEFRAYDVWEP